MSPFLGTMKKPEISWGGVGFFIEMIALTLWVGGLLVLIAVVIPATFNSFGMEPAGRFLRRTFDGFIQLNLGIVCILGVVASLRQFHFGQGKFDLFSVAPLEWWLIGGMALLTLSILLILGPQTVALQEQAFEAISEEEKKVAYDQFFRLHMINRALHLINVGFAASLFIFKLRRMVFHHATTSSPRVG